MAATTAADPQINRESYHEHTFPCRRGPVQGFAALLFSFRGGGAVGAVAGGGRKAVGAVGWAEGKKTSPVKAVRAGS